MVAQLAWGGLERVTFRATFDWQVRQMTATRRKRGEKTNWLKRKLLGAKMKGKPADSRRYLKDSHPLRQPSLALANRGAS
jgi:hypothetical protein